MIKGKSKPTKKIIKLSSFQGPKSLPAKTLPS